MATDEEKFNSACEKFNEILDVLQDLSSDNKEDTGDAPGRVRVYKIDWNDNKSRPTIAGVMQVLADYRGVKLDEPFTINKNGNKQTYIIKQFRVEKEVSKKIRTTSEREFHPVEGIPDDLLKREMYPTIWQPSVGKEMYHVDFDGDEVKVMPFYSKNVMTFAAFKNMGNLFPTREEAEKHADTIRKVLNSIMEDDGMGVEIGGEK